MNIVQITRKQILSYSLFIYQDENEDENQSFRTFLYVLKQTRDEQANNSI